MNMNLFNILEAICDKIKLRFPENPIYIMQVPQGFKRPSFYVNLVSYSDRDLCKDGLWRKAMFEIVLFAEQDAKGTVSTFKQLMAQQQLTQIFQSQSLQVKDRFLKIDNVYGASRDSEIYLTLSLEYGFTPDKFDGEDPENNIELMKEFSIKYQ